MLDHLFVIVLAGGLLCICAAIGYAAIRALGLNNDDSAIEALAFSVATGAGLLSTAILLCAAVVGVGPAILTLTVLSAAIIGGREMQRLPALVVSAARELKEKAGTPALVLVGMVAAGMIVQAVAPPADYDSLMYHLRVPAQFLERGAIYVPEDNLHVAFVGLIHLLYLPFLALAAPAACALVNVVFAFALGAVLLSSGTRFMSSSAGRLAMALFAGTPLVVLVAVTPKVDVTLAFFLFMGHYALLRSLSCAEDPMRWITLGAVLLGFAVGIKYLAFAYLVALGPIILASVILAGRMTVQRVQLLAVFGFVFAASASPWLVKNMILLGAPLYPFFAATTLPPWLAALHGTASLPSTLDSATLEPLLAVREPFNLVRWFVAPEQLTPEGEGSSYGANPAFVLLPLGIALLRNRAFAALLIPGLTFIGVILLQGPYLNLRYLIPSLPILTAATACVIATGIVKVRLSSRQAALMLTVAVALSLGPSLLALGRKLTATRAPAQAVGILSRDDYWHDSHNAEIASYARMTAHVNNRLPKSARVLLLFEGRGYGYTARVLQDNLLTNWPLLVSIISPSRCLESSGITHVLVNTEVLGYFVNRGLDPNLIRWDRFDEFANRCLALLERHDGVDLYRVLAESGGSAD